MAIRLHGFLMDSSWDKPWWRAHRRKDIVPKIIVKGTQLLHYLSFTGLIFIVAKKAIRQLLAYLFDIFFFLVSRGSSWTSLLHILPFRLWENGILDRENPLILTLLPLVQSCDLEKPPLGNTLYSSWTMVPKEIKNKPCGPTGNEIKV